MVKYLLKIYKIKFCPSAKSAWWPKGTHRGYYPRPPRRRQRSPASALEMFRFCVSIKNGVSGWLSVRSPIYSANTGGAVFSVSTQFMQSRGWKNNGCCGRLNAGGGFVMITIENCLPPIIGWVCSVVVAVILENLCSCYFPFLLSSKFYYQVRNKKLQSILISPQRTRSKDSETAPEDRNKLPLLGCIFCAVIFPWLFCEIVILLIVLALVLLESDFLYSPFMTHLISICEFLFLNECFWIFITVMPLLYMIDYSLGLCRWQKHQKRWGWRCPNKQKLRFSVSPKIAVSSFCGNRGTACQATKLLPHNLLQQCFVAIHHIVHYPIAGNGFEVFSRTVDFGLLDQPQLHRTHRAFCFRHLEAISIQVILYITRLRKTIPLSLKFQEFCHNRQKG